MHLHIGLYVTLSFSGGTESEKKREEMQGAISQKPEAPSRVSMTSELLQIPL